jgi:hypothetical protein
VSMRDLLAEYDEDILCADGFDEAIIGVCHIGGNTIALYDMGKCIEILMRDDEMSYEDAADYFHYNVLGSYVGEKTPAFAEFLHDI